MWRCRLAQVSRVFCGMTWTSPSPYSMATYFRASSSTAGSDLGNKPSRVKVPHECQRFLVTSRAPHRGQMLTPGGPSSGSEYPMSDLLPRDPQTRWSQVKFPWASVTV